MTKTSGQGANLVAAIILLGLGGVNFGYALSTMINNSGDAIPQMGIGAMIAGVSLIFFRRAVSRGS